MMKYIYLLVIVFLASCASEPDLNVGYKGFELKNNLDDIRKKVQQIKQAPKHVSESRCEGCTEFMAIEEPTVLIEGMQFNPSVFFVLNKDGELVSFKIIYLCATSKEGFDLEYAISKLNNNQIKGLQELSEKEGMKMQVGNEIVKQITLDMESMDNPVLEYEIKYLP